jgi:hypothetical protein
MEHLELQPDNSMFKNNYQSISQSKNIIYNQKETKYIICSFSWKYMHKILQPIHGRIWLVTSQKKFVQPCGSAPACLSLFYMFNYMELSTIITAQLQPNTNLVGPHN